MIDYINGQLTELTPATAIVECGGVGYEIYITLTDYALLQGKSTVKLYIHEAIREDAHVLYGFCDKPGRQLFRLLVGVSGVGSNTARLIMSAYPVALLEEAIATGDEKMLKGVKGVGARTAQRIIVDLKDKINTLPGALNSSVAEVSSNSDDAEAALVMLGFQPMQTKKVLKKLFTDRPDLKTEEAIKLALKMM